MLPEDSHVTIHFKALFKHAEIGLPIWFVMKQTGFDYKSYEGQDLIRGGASSTSLVSQIAFASKYPNVTYVGKPASAWIDEFYDWAKNDKCCRVDTNTGAFCPSAKNASKQ